MPALGEVDGRARVDCCAGAGTLRAVDIWSKFGGTAANRSVTPDQQVASTERGFFPPDQFWKVKRLKPKFFSSPSRLPGKMCTLPAAARDLPPCLTVTLQNFRGIPRADLSYMACICRKGPNRTHAPQQRACATRSPRRRSRARSAVW